MGNITGMTDSETNDAAANSVKIPEDAAVGVSIIKISILWYWVGK